MQHINKDKIFISLFLVFTVIFELYHVVINTNPPMIMRVIYTAVYLGFAIVSPALIPTYTAINLIVERFSSSFGEFLPNTLLFHIAVLMFGLLSLKYSNSVFYTKSYDRRMLTSFLLLYIYGIIALLLHVNINPDFTFVINGAFMLLYLYLISRLRDKYLKTIIKCSVAAMSIVCLIGLFNYDNLVGEYATSLGDVDRLEWKDANYFSFSIGIILMFTLYLARYTKSKIYKRSLLCSALLMLVTMVSLISRGAIVALVITILYYYRKDVFTLRGLGYAVAVSVFLIALYYVGLMDGLIMRFMSEDVQTGSGRTDIWQIGLETFFSKDIRTIIFGAGEGQAIKMAYLDGQYWSPHNNYLAVMYNYGITGLVIFCMWMLSLLVCSRTRESRALVLFIAVSCFTIVPFTYVSALWLIVPLIMVWDRRIYGRLQ